uniref:SnoaL-like domain-containing protein n=1 Tax=Globisporangium ultimum (strain ATCC 200006 / CBS 805.95 / DAOM BR144) TaxID=431595 RepID=K3X1Q9_GLOUD
MGVATAVTNEHVDVVKKYVSLRLVKDTKATLALVSDDIEFYSQRDGSYKGKEQFEQYLEKTKIEGTWQDPAIEDDDEQHVIVRGVVKIFYIPISVKSTFTFNDEGLICNIHTGKA